MEINILTGQKHLRLKKFFIKEEPLMKKQFIEALKRSKRESINFFELIFNKDLESDDKILEILSKYYNLPAIKLRDKVISPLVISLIPKEISEKYKVVVFKKIKEVIHVATTEPENKQIIEFIKKKTGLKPELFITTPKDIELSLRWYKSKIKEDFAVIIDNSIKEALAAEETIEKMAQFVPVVRMVNNIVDRALSQNASDIHIEPNFSKVLIRFRIDGILREAVELPKEILPAILARIKILSNLKIDEHMAPQDGRFHHKFRDQEIAIRVSIIPTLHGGKIALRLLEMKQKVFTLNKLGLNRRDAELLKNGIKVSQGMILVTGPTGSGKTTTLYTLLKMLNKVDVNICTIEDPVEYGVDNINQTQVRPQAGLTFATGLRSLLRQDPNIIMVGEIRDLETANIAFNAAMTGHLVLSTLHTNNAFLAPQRLVEMGVQPYLVSSVVNLIIGQRLTRSLCPKCKAHVRDVEKYLSEYDGEVNYRAAFNKLKRVGLIPEHKELADMTLHRARGCNKCANGGYTGRSGIYELIKVNDGLRRQIIKNNSEAEVKNNLLNAGVLTMAEDGMLNVFTGQTTVDEVLRVTKE